MPHLPFCGAFGKIVCSLWITVLLLVTVSVFRWSSLNGHGENGTCQCWDVIVSPDNTENHSNWSWQIHRHRLKCERLCFERQVRQKWLAYFGWYLMTSLPKTKHRKKTSQGPFLYLGNFPGLALASEKRNFFSGLCPGKLDLVRLIKKNQNTSTSSHTCSEGNTACNLHPTGIPHSIHFLVKLKYEMWRVAPALVPWTRTFHD